MSITLPKRFHENPEGFQWSFLVDHVRWCCMRTVLVPGTEQCYQRSFVIPSTILETTTASKLKYYHINYNDIGCKC